MDRIDQGVVGFRTWLLRPADDELGIPRVWLAALSSGHTEGRGVWWPGLNEAVCTLIDPKIIPTHDPPSWDCACGYHAWYTPEILLGTAVGRRLTRMGHAVQGMCLGTGRVALQRRQWRAQKARVLALFQPEPLLGSRDQVPERERMLLVEQAAEWYEVPIVPREEAFLWAQLAGANGQRLYDESP